MTHTACSAPLVENDLDTDAGEGLGVALAGDFSPELETFRRDVLRGLSSRPKTLPCKYFYDETGSRLFDRICDLEEYYPTRTEIAIMERSVGEMADRLGPHCAVIEYGSGSSVKTPILLDALHEPAAYVPLDISCDHLMAAAQKLQESYPDLAVIPVCADYTSDYELPEMPPGTARRVVYFPGSTIGNFDPEEAVRFLHHAAEVCGAHGGLLIGVDLDKDRTILERAYDDREGVTAAFNLNLLHRINRELDADFDVAAFRHRAVYNAAESRIEMHLESRRPQTVHVGNVAIRFAEGETIDTEHSNKFSLERFRELAGRAGFQVEEVWTDPDELFSVQYLTVI